VARATTIWVVLDDSGKVIAGFTVRHQLVKWLEKTNKVVTLAKVRDEEPDSKVISLSVDEVKALK
jgi:hypothetical protein